MRKPKQNKPNRKRYIEQLPPHYKWAVSLFLIGGYLLFHGSHYYGGPPKAKNWPLAEASIKNIEIGKGICLGYREIDFASIRFDFTYEVNGKTYSDYFFNCAWDIEQAQSILQDLKSGKHLRRPDESSSSATNRDVFKVRFDPENPERHAIDIGQSPAASWYFFSALLLVPTFPFVIVVPLWNLFISLGAGGKRKGPVNLVRSVIPLFYHSKVREVLKRALKEAGPTKARYHHWISISDAETRGFVHLVFSSDGDLSDAKASGWLKELSASFNNNRVRSALPIFAEERFSIAVHSNEEIRRTGEYDYWK